MTTLCNFRRIETQHVRQGSLLVDLGQLCVVGVEKAADTRMARAIDVDQLTILPHAASPQMCTSGFGDSSLVGSSTTVEKTFASVFESTPVHGDLPLR